MRALPFRVIFVAGLGEGCFPAADRKSHLDLRQVRRRAGDVSAREQDQYLFLDTLLGARDRLYLSWVCRDPLTGDPRQMSPVAADLSAYLQRGYLAPGGAAALETRYPLFRHEDAHTRAASPAAAAELQAAELGADLARHLRGPLPTLQELRDGLAPPVRDAVIDRLALTTPPPPVRGDDGEPVVRVSLGDLRAFLECPLQGSTRFLLGLRDEGDDDPAARADERFTTPPLFGVPLLRDVFLSSLAAGRSTPEELASAYDAAAEREVQRGVVPVGPFGEADRRIHLTALVSWLEAVRTLGAAAPTRLRFGPSDEWARAAEEHPPLVLPITLKDGRRVRVELRGHTEPQLNGTAGAGTFMLATRAPADSTREALRGFVEHAALAAAGLAQTPHHHVWVASPGDLTTRRLRALAPDAARSWLGTLCTDLLSNVHEHLLPCEAVFAHHKKPEVPIEEQVDKLRENPYGHYSSKWGPVKGIDRFDAPEEADAQEIVKRRFAPFFDHLEPVTE
jgi:exodeoxyribonuclease V gamma subunit